MLSPLAFGNLKDVVKLRLFFDISKRFVNFFLFYLHIPNQYINLLFCLFSKGVVCIFE